MKAKNLKQHQIPIEVEEELDEWGDRFWRVEGREYKLKEQAVSAARKIMEDEFRERYIK